MKAIALDMIGVVVREEKIVSGRLFGMLGAPGVTREELKERYDKGLSVGKMTEEDFWDGVTGDDWRSIRSKFLEGISVDDSLREILRKFKPNYRLAIVSDMAGTWGRELMELHDLSQFLDVQIYSSETGKSKKDPATFSILVEKLDVQPGEILYVDDRPANVALAREVGLYAVLFDEEAKGAADVSEVISSLQDLPDLVARLG